MNRQPGFSVIELVISIMISAMLMTAALAIYNQISKGMVTVQTLTQQDIAAIMVRNRLSQDLIGLCPIWFTPDSVAKQTESPEQDAKEPVQPQAAPPTPPNNPNIQKNNYMYAQSKDDQLNYITFVTSSTLQTYINPEYRCARVVYVLTPDPEREGLFNLRRKEEQKISNEFDKETITQGEFYTLAKNISKCVLEYGFIDMPPQDRAEKLDPEWKMKWVKQWGVSDAQTPPNQYTPTLPDMVRIKITVQENQEKPGKDYELYCLLPQSKEATFQSFAQKRKLEQRNAKQPATPPGSDKNPAGSQPGSAHIAIGVTTSRP